MWRIGGGVEKVEGEATSALFGDQTVVGGEPLERCLDVGIVDVGSTESEEEARMLRAVDLDGVGVERLLIISQVVGGVVVYPGKIAWRVGVEVRVAVGIRLQIIFDVDRAALRVVITNQSIAVFIVLLEPLRPGPPVLDLGALIIVGRVA